jgi:hypothetical protein
MSRPRKRYRPRRRLISRLAGAVLAGRISLEQADAALAVGR